MVQSQDFYKKVATMTIEGVQQLKRGAESEPIDYEALAKQCLDAGTAGFQNFDTFDADASCRIAHGKKPRVAGEESDDEKSKTRSKAEIKEEEDFNARKILKNPPKELKSIGSYEDDADFITNWIAYIMGVWKEHLADPESELHKNDRASQQAFKDGKMLKKTEEWLRPLINVLLSRTVSDQIYGNLKEIALKCQKSQYKDAQATYVQMMVGNVKWHTDQCHGEARHNKGFNFRKVEADEGARLYDDQAVNNYCLAIKRLMSVSQVVQPHEDISNHV